MGVVSDLTQTMGRDIRLRPDDRPKKIMEANLRVADILCLASDWIGATVIREGTYSPLNHVAIYVGNHTVVEALGEGVTYTNLTRHLSNYYLAVAFRHFQITDDKRLQIKHFVCGAVGTPYNTSGAIASSGAELPGVRSTPGAFFCSQLACAAYNDARLVLAPNPAMVPPGKFEGFYHSGMLNYVGHLKLT